METIKVQIDEKKAMEVRMLAMQIYGPKKGSISAAVNEALREWVAKFSKLKKLLISIFSNIFFCGTLKNF